ncbi:MAG TPA: PASTA domain-containing protein [Pyrinomonadaceae bacterium]
MNQATGALSALRRLGIAIAIAVVFLFGLATTVYLSLRSPEVTVPDVVGKDRFQAEQVLGDAGLNFRVRATRPSNELKADTVLFQLPRAGEVVKAGQTVAMDISRTAMDGESSEAVVEKSPEEKPTNQNTNESATANENKPRRKPANKNDNSNDNRNANSNRSKTNANAKGNANANRSGANVNANRGGVNQNGNVRPSTPRPTPVAKPTGTNP